MKKAKMIRCVEPTEHQIQTAIVEWANTFYLICPFKVSHHLIAIPNGGYRNKSEAIRLKKEGVKSGVSDLFLAYPSRGFHGLWIEVKKISGKLSNDQKNWLDMVNACNYKGVVIYGVSQGIHAIKDYLGMK